MKTRVKVLIVMTATLIAVPSTAYSDDNAIETCLSIAGDQVSTDYELRVLKGEGIYETDYQKVQDSYSVFESLRPEYDKVVENVVLQEAMTELVYEPAEFDWVEGEHPGSSAHLIVSPPVFENRDDSKVTRPAHPVYVNSIPHYEGKDGQAFLINPPELVELTVPAKTEKFTRRIVVKPARTEEVFAPNIIKNGRTFMVVKPASIKEKMIPAKIETWVRMIVKTPAGVVERVVNEPVYEAVSVLVGHKPDRFILTSSSGKKLMDFKSIDAFENFKRQMTCEVLSAMFGSLEQDIMP